MSTSEALNTRDTAGYLPLRLLKEGYGPGAWHGADMKAALADVTSALAFWRPGPGRHNIAEIALHHAYYVWSVRTRVSGRTDEPFLLDGEDWFVLEDPHTMAWATVRDAVDAEQSRLAAVFAEIESGQVQSPLAAPERFDLALGITCHAVYHAGQMQLIKRLQAA